MNTLITNCMVLDPETAWGCRTGLNILIEDQRIASVSPQPVTTPVDRRIDGTNFLAIPGLVNAHTHSPENLAKATNDNMPFEPWLIHTNWALGDLNERDYYLNTMVGCIEMLRSGTTSVLDHLGFSFKAGIAQIGGAMRAYRESGMRAGVAPLFRQRHPEIKDGDERGFALSATVMGRLPPAPDMPDLLALFDQVFADWHGAERGRLSCWVGPSGVQWFTPEMLQACFDLARRWGGGLHMHLMETRVQDQIVRKLHGKTAVALLADEGLLAPNVSLPHSVWVTDSDIERIAAAGAVPVHNPAANLRLGSGLSPIRKMFDVGIVPGLGADGAKSSDHQNMFGHMHLAALIHNLTDIAPDRWLSSRQAVAMATQGGAAVLMRPGELGAIAPGYLADITLLDLRGPALVPLNDAIHHLAFSELGQSVHTVIIDGKVVVEAARIVAFDADAILDEAREAARGRVYRGAVPPEWQDAIDRHLAYQQHVLRTTRFEA